MDYDSQRQRKPARTDHRIPFLREYTMPGSRTRETAACASSAVEADETWHCLACAMWILRARSDGVSRLYRPTTVRTFLLPSPRYCSWRFCTRGVLSVRDFWGWAGRSRLVEWVLCRRWRGRKMSIYCYIAQHICLLCAELLFPSLPVFTVGAESLLNLHHYVQVERSDFTRTREDWSIVFGGQEIYMSLKGSV